MADSKLSALGTVTTLAGANKIYAAVGGVSKGITMTSMRADTEILTNKTLTSPKIGTAIVDTNGNEIIKTPATGSAVNEVTVTNAATGTGPTIAASGGDTDVDLNISAKGEGRLNLTGHEVKIDHIATANEDIALEIDMNSDTFAQAIALDIAYNAGTLAAGEEDISTLTTIDESNTTGGEIIAQEVLTTDEGVANVIALRAGAVVDPIEQLSGTFADPDSILVKAVDELSNLTTPSTPVNIFVADDDTMTIGDAAKFFEIEFILDTGSSGSGIAPTFEYSTGVGTWQVFGPTDGTNAMRNTGAIAWDAADVVSPAWVVGTGSEFLIRITRTRNTLATTPIADIVQKAAITEFGWNKTGDITTNTISAGVTVNDTTDTTKKALFDVSAIATATTRTITMPNSNVDLTHLALAFTRQTITYASGTTTAVWTAGYKGIMTFGAGNITTFAFTNPAISGVNISLEVKQDSVGGRIITTWDADILWVNNVIPTLTTTANATDFFSFYWNGTNYLGSVGKGFLTA